MSFRANATHHTALLLISLGAMSVLGLAGAVVIAAGPKPVVGVVCCFVSVGMGFFLIRSGLRMRKRAIDAGSTAHIGDDGDVHTSHTGTARPSFLKDKRPRDNDF
jgi:hypothetical protein